MQKILSSSVQSIAKFVPAIAKFVPAIAAVLGLGAQGAHAANRRIFIGTANITIPMAQQRCSNIAAQVAGSSPTVAVNWMGLKDCYLNSPRDLTEAESRKFGNSYTYGS
jgi:hypothetical protein